MRIKSLNRSLAGVVWLGILFLIGSRAPAQNLFVTDYNSNSIYQFSPGGAKSTLISGLDGPYGIAFNKAGVLFETEGQTNGNIYEVTNGTRAVFAPGFRYPAGLAFDRNGNLFVASESGGVGIITEITPNGSQNLFATNIYNPLGLAFDSAGNLYVTSFLDVSGTIEMANIYKYTTNGTQSTFSTLTTNDSPVALAFDGAGNLFVANAYSNNIIKIATNGIQSTFAALYNPQALVFDPRGNLFVADGDGGNIMKVTPAGVLSTNISGLSDPVGLAFAPIPVLGGAITNGSYQLTVSMPSPYYSTVVQAASTNFMHWTAVYTNTPPFVYTDTATANCRFYRAFLGQ